MTRHSFVTILMLCLTGENFLLAQASPAALTEEQVRIKLYAFCQEGMLHDRGFANTPFAGGADDWIVTALLERPDFCGLMGLSRDLEGAIVKVSEGPEFEDPLIEPYEQFLKAFPGLASEFRGYRSSGLRKLLNEEQRKNLAYARLQLEGLMYLCRPEAKTAFNLSEDLQKSIRNEYVSVFSDKSSPIHRGNFSGQGFPPDEMAIYVVELRRITSEADWKIVKMLNEEQCRSLLNFIAGAHKFRASVYGGGIDGIRQAPNTVK